MTEDELESLCEAARQRLAEFVNRSAAQHLRRMLESWRKACN